MKKKLLTTLFVLTLVTAATCFSFPHLAKKAKASDTADTNAKVKIEKLDEDTDKNDTKEKKQKIRYKIIVSTNYYTPQYCKKAVLHYGVNGWNDIKEVDMYRAGETIQGDGLFNEYFNYAAIVTVNAGDTIDYCFKFLTWEDDAGWINNDNKDYHVTVTSSNVPCSLTIEYHNPIIDINDINYIDMCYTLNNWKTYSYTTLERNKIIINGVVKKDYYSCCIHGYETDTLEYCYKIMSNSGKILWDNNDGKNYVISPLIPVK